MKLTVVGCSPAWPNPGGAQSGYLVDDRLLLTAELHDVTLPLLARTDDEVVVDLTDATTDGAVTVELPATVEPQRATRDDA